MNANASSPNSPDGDSWASKFSVENLRTFADSTIENSCQSILEQVDANAVAIWLHHGDSNGEVLTISYNVGGKGAELEGKISQPLDTGLVSKAFRESSTICHQGIFNHQEQSTDVDRELRQMTAHQIAVPFSIAGTLIGAATVIQTQDSESIARTNWGFDDAAIKNFESWVEIVQRLFELNARRAS